MLKDDSQSPKAGEEKGTSFEAQTDSGVIAQGNNAQAVGDGGVLIDGNIENSNLIVGDNNRVVVIYQGKKVVIPSPESVARHRVALKERLEKEASTRWGGMSFYIQEEGVTLPIQASPYQVGQLGARTNLQDSLKSASRMLVLGDPGSGKTIALERLAWELCVENEPVIPVLIRLFHYDGKPLAEWVRSRLQECGCLRLDDEQTLTVFLQETASRCVFLFDGLNEVVPEFRNLLVGELDRWMSANPRHSVIVTSRVQDELWRRLRGELPAMVVQPISSEQAHAYLTAHLGAKGDELYQRLDEHLLGLARTPLVLWLIKEAGLAGESLPGNRGELYARFVGKMLRRDTERQMDIQFSERVKQQALATLALHMSRAQRLTCPRDEAVNVIANSLVNEGSEKLDHSEALVAACARHGLLTGEDELWFAPHQTVQEHFAAVALQECVSQEVHLSRAARVWRHAQQTLTGRKTGLNALTSEEWWMETLVQLAGISADPTWLVRVIAQTNPWLAWWCVQEGRTVDESTRIWIENRSITLLKSSNLNDRRRAVQTLVQTRNERVLRPLLQAAADEDAEVSRLALQGLLDMGEAARALMVELLRGKDESMWKLILHYLSDQPESALWEEITGRIRTESNLLGEARNRLQKLAGDIPLKKGDITTLFTKMTPINALTRLVNGQMATRFWKLPYGEPEWITIPSGEFCMGGEGEYDGKPVHKLALPEYQIARVPVTNAQYALFVHDTKMDPPAHWHGGNVPSGLENHPVVNVSWYVALAYCQWLGEKIEKLVSLPSEAEWEKAARGDQDIRAYPWGDGWLELHCNTAELGLGGTTPVGLFLNGASPYGLLDMSGNVWEWTRTVYADKFNYPYNTKDGRENLQGGAVRVLRGGSFSDDADLARCAFRPSYDPFSGGSLGGFRVMVVSPGLLSHA